MKNPRLLTCGDTVFILALALYFAPQIASRISYAVQEEGAPSGGAPGTVQDLSLPFKRAAKIVAPSVVNITSVRIIKPGTASRAEPTQNPQDPSDDFWERFFGQRIRQGMKQTGEGTGVVVSRDGTILTNNHMVADADEVTVRLSDDRQHRAKVVGTDPKTDLAVIKIEAGDLAAAKLGDSDALEPGEWVLAMGNAFGLEGTLTAGIVSAKGRSKMGIVAYEDFIQTDAAINPGNSGGPLLNLRGEVVGINTAIFSRSGGSMGIGFAIPTKMARSVLDAILKEGRVVRGFLGVALQDLTPQLAESFGYQGAKGAVVTSVEPGSPAARAGLKEGDIIVSFNGAPVEDGLQLKNLVASLRPGTRAEMEVFRGGKIQTLTAQVGELKSPTPPNQERESTGKLGMAVKTLTPELSAQLGQREDLTGVVVVSVEPGGLADKAGLQPRDIILAVGDQKVNDVTEFQRELEKHDLKRGLRMQVRRGPANLYVFVGAQAD